MTDILKISELRSIKNGELTPKNILLNLLEHIDDIEDLVVSLKAIDGEVRTAYSHMNQLSAIGLYEMGKAHTMSDMYIEY